MRNNILIMSVFHQKSARDNAESGKAELFIQFQRGVICADNCVKLKYAKAKPFSLFHTVRNKNFADMPSAQVAPDRVARVAYMSASADIVRVQNIQSDRFAAFLVIGYSRKGLREKNSSPDFSSSGSVCGNATPSKTTLFHMPVASVTSSFVYCLTFIFILITPSRIFPFKNFFKPLLNRLFPALRSRTVISAV